MVMLWSCYGHANSVWCYRIMFCLSGPGEAPSLLASFACPEGGQKTKTRGWGEEEGEGEGGEGWSVGSEEVPQLSPPLSKFAFGE